LDGTPQTHSHAKIPVFFNQKTHFGGRKLGADKIVALRPLLRGKSRKHLHALSFSAFDRTFPANALDT
jgi:hypothetical protein